MQTPFILFLGDIGGSELMLIMVVILIFFGANKIPELARGLGKGIREFKDASTEIRSEFEQAGQPAPPNYTQQQPPSTTPSQPLPRSSRPGSGAGSGFDPWAAPGYCFGAPNGRCRLFCTSTKTDEPAAPVAPTLPPNLAPEGTQPRQPTFRLPRIPTYNAKPGHLICKSV